MNRRDFITIESLNDMAERVHELAREKGFYEYVETEGQYIERSCNKLHDDVIELHDAYRNGKLRERCDKSDKMEDAGISALSCLEEELADIIIRALDISVKMGVDIGHSVIQKHLFNKTRPYQHGGKLS